tara:strand:+ start:28265 stop:28477 length:213 start_codon:yes stop_codon:yes gene_type:complete
MENLIIMGMLALFYGDNHEFFEKVREQRAQGYEWKYVGYKEWDGKSPALLINRDTNPHVYWKLVKPEEKK